MEVFPKFHAIPFSKMLTFYRKEPFSLEARYSCPEEVPIPDPGIGMFSFSEFSFLYHQNINRHL